MGEVRGWAYVTPNSVESGARLIRFFTVSCRAHDRLVGNARTLEQAVQMAASHNRRFHLLTETVPKNGRCECRPQLTCDLCIH